MALAAKDLQLNKNDSLIALPLVSSPKGAALGRSLTSLPGQSPRATSDSENGSVVERRGHLPPVPESIHEAQTEEPTDALLLPKKPMPSSEHKFHKLKSLALEKVESEVISGISPDAHLKQLFEKEK